MTPDDLAKACIKALSDPVQKFQFTDPVVGVSGRHKAPLPKKSFPRWKYVSFGAEGKPVYHYPAKELLRALAYHGMIDLEDYRVPELRSSTADEAKEAVAVREAYEHTEASPEQKETLREKLHDAAESNSTLEELYSEITPSGTLPTA